MVCQFQYLGESSLHMLILNAAYHGDYRKTKDGFEQNFGVNHLGICVFV